MTEFRLMHPDDYAAVYALWLSCAGMGLNDLDDSEEGIIKFLHRNPDTCFVAFSEGQVIGAILAGNDGRRGYLYHTAVLPACRGRGIAAALVSRALEALRACGIHKVALVAFRRNNDGNAFWESQGFAIRDDLVYRDRALTPLHHIVT